MLISKNISINTYQGRKLVPLSEYKGVILKLTPKDKAEISRLQGLKSQYELELHEIETQLQKVKKTITKQWRQLSNKELKLWSEIDTINKLIIHNILLTLIKTNLIHVKFFCREKLPSFWR